MKRRVVVLVVALLGMFVAPVNGEVNGADTSDPATSLLNQINQERAARGLVALRVDRRLSAIATERATRLATYEVLSHTLAGSIPANLADRSVRWYGYGEVIGYASGSPGEAGRSIFGLWMASPDHWPLLMSARYNYLGVGLVYQPNSGLTYSSVVLTESPDQTGAQAMVGAPGLSGNDIHWSWHGWDPPLQTHTAGVRDFTVQLRVDGGAWVTVAAAVTATARSTVDRASGHWYGLRVRARDRAGNVGPWSRERRVWLP